MYWIPNSVVSLLQTQVLKTNAMRKAFDIPDPPVEAPSRTKQSAFSKLQNVAHLSIINDNFSDQFVLSVFVRLSSHRSRAGRAVMLK